MSSMTNLGPLHKSAEVSEDEGLCSNSSGKTIICPVNCQCDLHYLSKEEVKEEEYDAVEQPIGQVEMEERQPEVVPVAEPVLEVQPMVLQQEVVPQVVPVAEPVLQVQQVVAQQEVVQQ